jgi:hypothetical protein
LIRTGGFHILGEGEALEYQIEFVVGDVVGEEVAKVGMAVVAEEVARASVREERETQGERTCVAVLQSLCEYNNGLGSYSATQCIR